MALHHRSPHGTFSIRRVPMGPAVTHPWRLQFIIKVSARSFLMRRVPMAPFSIQRVPVGPTVTHPWCLQFIIKVSTWSFHHSTCTCGTLLHPTYGTWCLTCHFYRWDLSPSPSDLWDPTACVSLVPCVPSGFNFSKKVWYLGVEPGIWTKNGASLPLH